MAAHGSHASEELFEARAYQDEMLQQSMQQNIIVAADTGSGKTLIAILRIKAELETCPAGKFVWFCVPTVALAMQQYKAISTQLPAFQARVLSGADNVDFWTEQWIWDDILKGIRIVVSTHQVLLDVLIHGFVRMKQLALIVFDEAHSCIGNHPSSRIMHDFYHTCNMVERPAILGLTASPVINSKVGSLGLLESNLNAISRTPKLHREEMLKFVQRPKLEQLMYLASGTEQSISLALESLAVIYEGLDIEHDPWIIKMKADPSTADSSVLKKVMISHKTYCHEQIRGLYDRAFAIYKELGPWATDYYICQCIQKFRRGAVVGSLFIGLEDTETSYLREKFSQIEFTNQDAGVFPGSQSLTPKVQELLNFLQREDSVAFSGLVFVKTRAEVAVLSHILSICVPTFAISTFVGASSFSGHRTTVGELVDVKNQKDTLDDLRIDVAKCNIVVCFDRPPNLKSFIQRRGRARKDISRYVIMFKDDGSQSDDLAKLLKLEEDMIEMYMDDMRKLEALRALEDIEEDGEQELRNESTGAKLTLDDAVQHLYHFCATLPAAPYVDQRPVFTFDSTSPGSEKNYFSAKVTLPNSVDASVREAHSVFRWKTEKMAKRDAAFEAYAALYRAGLINENFLPLGHVDESIDEAYTAIEKRPSLVAVAERLNPWLSVAQEWQGSENISTATIEIKEDKRFIAEMLMLLPCSIPSICPFTLHWNAATTYQAECKPGAKAYNPSHREAAMQVTYLLFQSHFGNRMDLDRCDFAALFIPSDVYDLREWASERSGTTKALDLRESDVQGNNAGIVRDLSENSKPYIFHDVHYDCFEDADLDDTMDIDQYEKEHQAYSTGAEYADCSCESRALDSAMDLTYHETKEPAPSNGSQHLYPRKQTGTSGENLELKQHRDIGGARSKDKCVDDNPHRTALIDDTYVDESDKNDVYVLLEVSRLPKKVDFLHHVQGQDAKNANLSALRTLPAKSCVMDKLPFTYSRFAAFLPSILHKVGVAMVVDRLCETLLSPLQFNNRQLVATAIAAPSAGEGTDYNRLEFRGDSSLKFFTSLVLMANHLNYHEGILSHKKDHIVSNSSLATGAIQKGLAPFILTKAFTGSKWRPIYNGNLLKDQPPETREMSSKTLADVVEALLGAAYLDGGTEKALICLNIFLPEIPWFSALQASEILHKAYSQQTPTVSHLSPIEKLIAYEFGVKSLLIEALTHASHHGPNSSASYQRLEFLGDSVLDNIVTTTAFSHEPPIATHNLHLVRAALVNGNFLGYLCLTLFTSLQRAEIVANDPKNVSTVQTSYPFYLWQAMRHASPAVSSAQQECLARLETVSDELAAALANGSSYPWTLLARLEPPKFLSDIIESLLGAIYIDTRGSLAQCESFLENLGLMAYLRRVMHNRIAILHPKEQLGQLSNQDTVKYVLGKEGEEGGMRLTCTVMVGQRQVVRVDDGLSVMEVQTRAADAACKVLRGEGREIRNNMGYSNGPRVNETRNEAGAEEEEAEEEETGEVESRVEANKEKEAWKEKGNLAQEDERMGAIDYDSDEYMTAHE